MAALNRGDSNCTSGLSKRIFDNWLADGRSGFSDPLDGSGLQEDMIRALCWAAARGVADEVDLALAPPSWTTATLLNGWAVWGGNWPVGYIKNAAGQVSLRGLIQPTGTAASGFTFPNNNPLILPVSHRPSSERIFTIRGGNTGTGELYVLANGELRLTVGPLAGQWISLDNATFQI